MAGCEGAGKTVCVTGASGYIASWLVKLLLERSYTVKASILDPSDPKQTDHLRELPGANKRLYLFKANLLDEGSFDTIVYGCQGVFHTASPCFFEAKDPQTELIDPAVKGTLNVLRSCAKTPSVERVILTSSIAAVHFNGNPLTPDVVVDETWFSDPEICRKSKLWYVLSKTLAEESAWEFAKSHGIGMVTIHPAMVIGPLLQPTLNTSAEIILNLINGVLMTSHFHQSTKPPKRRERAWALTLFHWKSVLRKLLKTVCVTGGSGYIGSWLVKLLLERGYTIKAAILDPNDPKQTEHLREFLGANERLQFFKANLLDEGSFDTIVKDCDAVFHMASPCIDDSKVKDPQAELIDPAVKGTLNVLGSCAKTPSVKRVIVTCSMGTVLFNGNPLTPEVVADETWFSDPEFCRKAKLWYLLSKTLAEQAARKFAKSHGIDMVTIHPAWVIGPLLQPTLNGSTEFILNFIKGAQTYDNLTSGFVDVRDVANAHIRAFEIPSASGRYTLDPRVVHLSEIVNILRELYPDIHFAEKCADDKPFPPTYKTSQEKRKSLGIDFIPLEITLKETVESLKKKFLSLR